MQDIIQSKLINLTSKDDKISLYVHIPFCSTKCDYCAFYSESKEHWDKCNIVSKYLDKLIKEIQIVKESIKNKVFETVFIGGGNPGSLSVEQLRSLLITIGPSKETTFEINPESFSKHYEGYKSLFTEGLATRLSMGIQSMDDSILTILNRNASKSDNLKALNCVKDLSTTLINECDNYFLKNNLYEKSCITYNRYINFSLDLMTCLPTQTLEMAKDDIDYIIQLTNTSHISLYCLTVEEGTRLKERVGLKDVKVMDEDEQTEHLNSLWSYLNEKGFKHYEVSNFCKNNKECLHNNRYWGLKSYIGLGSHSASTLYDDNTLVRLYNNSTFNEYISSDLFSNYEEEDLDNSLQREEYLLVALRCDKGISKSILEQKYSVKPEVLQHTMSQIDNGLYVETNDNIVLNEKGFMVLDSIVLQLAIAFDSQNL